MRWRPDQDPLPGVNYVGGRLPNRRRTTHPRSTTAGTAVEADAPRRLHPPIRAIHSPPPASAPSCWCSRTRSSPRSQNHPVTSWSGWAPRSSWQKRSNGTGSAGACASRLGSSSPPRPARRSGLSSDHDTVPIRLLTSWTSSWYNLKYLRPQPAARICPDRALLISSTRARYCWIAGSTSSSSREIAFSP